MEYLFDHWSRIKKSFKCRHLFIFLDFDGTMAPIVKAPAKAVLGQGIRTLLGRLADNPRVELTFISGRNIEDLKNKIGFRNVIYSGNHGLEIEGPKIKFKPVVPPRFKKALEKIKDDLKTETSLIKGILIEDKGLSLSLHYRLVDKRQVSQVKRVFHKIVALPRLRNQIRTRSGKMVLEVLPPVDWDKGKAVLWILAKKAFLSGIVKPMPVYIGDDITDEDAFKALKRKGLAIFVGKQKKSYARYYLKGPRGVAAFLKKLSAELLCQN